MVNVNDIAHKAPPVEIKNCYLVKITISSGSCGIPQVGRIQNHGPFRKWGWKALIFHERF
jgi:hypothetical protein